MSTLFQSPICLLCFSLRQYLYFPPTVKTILHMARILHMKYLSVRCKIPILPRRVPFTLKFHKENLNEFMLDKNQLFKVARDTRAIQSSCAF